jgi:hypothetical protein
MTNQEKFSNKISDLNKLLLSSNLDNEIVFELVSIFYTESKEQYNKGINQTKEIYNL